MFDQYKLVDSGKPSQWHVVSPHGERLAVVVKTNSGIAVLILNTKLPRKLNGGKYETLEDARRAVAAADYKLNTSSPQRVFKRITLAVGNPIWGWLYGFIATIAAIWGWLDRIKL